LSVVVKPAVAYKSASITAKKIGIRQGPGGNVERPGAETFNSIAKAAVKPEPA